MGLLGMIGKMAGSTVIKKVENELTKKQNREQTSKYCVYIKNNLSRVRNSLTDLQDETQTFISEIMSLKGVKIPFGKKRDFKKLQDKTKKNLQHLYLSRDFFTVLSKNISGIALQTEELLLVSKFAPYFDGVPVLDLDNANADDSFAGALKEFGQELRAAFISAKKNPQHFVFEEYLERYKEKLEKYEIPNVISAIESFENAMEVQEVNLSAPTDTTQHSELESSISTDEIECQNCHTKLNLNSKFCPECGVKIETNKPYFCSQCGELIPSEAKFCVNCGAKR